MSVHCTVVHLCLDLALLYCLQSAVLYTDMQLP